MPLIRQLFVIMLAQKFMKGRPDLCSEMTCQQNCTTHHGATADPRLYFDRIPASTTTSSTSFPPLHGAGIVHSIAAYHTLPRPVLLPRLPMARDVDVGLGNERRTLTSLAQGNIASSFEENLRRQQGTEHVNDAMLRIGEHQLLQQAINTIIYRS